MDSTAKFVLESGDVHHWWMIDERKAFCHRCAGTFEVRHEYRRTQYAVPEIRVSMVFLNGREIHPIFESEVGDLFRRLLSNTLSVASCPAIRDEVVQEVMGS